VDQVVQVALVVVVRAVAVLVEIIQVQEMELREHLQQVAVAVAEINQVHLQMVETADQEL